jgi:cytochrome P450
MGVPSDDIDEAKNYARGLVKFLFGRPDVDEQVATCDLIGRSHAYGKRLIERVLENAEGDGLLQYAVREHRRDPRDLERPHLDGLATSMLAAAHETTTNALGNAMRLLLEHPAAWAALCADPSSIPGAVEECLRAGLPMAITYRACLKDTTVGGLSIPAGAKVMLVLASANNDEAVFEQPYAFDIGRANARRHLAFGTGAHACLGARLARLEMRVVLEQLVRRLPHMRLVARQEYEYLNIASIGGPLALLVEWDPQANPCPGDRP